MLNDSYPTILTNKSWQKAKGAVAKAAGESGVGEALTKCEKAFPDKAAKDIAEFPTLKKKYETAKGIIKMKDFKKDSDLLEGYPKHNSAMTKYETELKAALKTAKYAALIYKGTKTIPASATKAANNIVEELSAEIERLNASEKLYKDTLAALTKYTAKIPASELPPAPYDTSAFKKLMKNSDWKSIIQEQITKSFNEPCALFLVEMTKGNYTKDNYDKFVAVGAAMELNLDPTDKKGFGPLLEKDDTDWSKGPWEHLTAVQLKEFRDNVWQPLKNAYL